MVGTNSKMENKKFSSFSDSLISQDFFEKLNLIPFSFVIISPFLFLNSNIGILDVIYILSLLNIGCFRLLRHSNSTLTDSPKQRLGISRTRVSRILFFIIKQISQRQSLPLEVSSKTSRSSRRPNREPLDSGDE